MAEPNNFLFGQLMYWVTPLVLIDLKAQPCLIVRYFKGTVKCFFWGAFHCYVDCAYGIIFHNYNLIVPFRLILIVLLLSENLKVVFFFDK